MKMKHTKAFFGGLIAILLGFVSSCASIKINADVKDEDKSVSGQLQITKQDYDISKFDRTSQIKAEYLLENNGYKDSDKVKAIVELNDQAVIDDYLKDNKEYETVGDYVTDKAVSKKIERLTLGQAIISQKLKSDKLIESVDNRYTTLLNGISVTTTYGNLNKIKKISGVKNVVLSDTYNQAQTTKVNGSDSSAVTNVVDVYETGIFNSSSVEYNGEGTAVAVLDSGFDCSHEVFDLQPTNQVITQSSIGEVLDQTRAAETTKGLKVSDVYYSKKIPFVYDYADKDPDVTPYDSEHGTHVAGIIGGKSETITGVATHTQLVLMKVFPNLQEGAETADILAALEDAVLLKVDTINMSLGSACGFVREEDGNVINTVYDKIYDSGINLICAASNDYNSSYGSEQGNNNKVTNPDSATVGSPSTYKVALSVASISGTKSRYIIGNGEQVIFFNESNNTAAKTYDFFEMLGIKEDKEYEYVTIPGYGTRLNYANCDVKGKIALVKRGDNTFEEKAKVAKAAGAAGIIIYNNVSGDIIMSMGKSLEIPTISISKDDGMKLAQKDKGTLLFSNDNLAGPFMSDFSSWGPTPNLELKPEITAHGGNILSALPGGGYDKLSGTSMASPNMCGIVVLIRQYVKDNYPELSAKEISVMVNQLLMSTATIALNQDGVPYSPRKQGAGLANLENAVSTRAYCTVDGIERSKIELGDDPKKIGTYELRFNIKNISNQPISYDLGIIAMTESVSTSDKDFIAEKDQYLKGNYEVKVLSGGSQNDKEVTVPAKGECKIKLTYKLSQEDKDLIDRLFPYGMFVEGFVTCKATDSNDKNLSLPFLGFYGDWTEAPMFDKTYYEVESEAHDISIDDEDKIKADVFATTPYGSYYYNYIIPLGTYLYDLDESMYDAIPASEEHIAVSSLLRTIDGISVVYAGLLRNAKEMRYTITDKTTGEVIYEHIAPCASKSHSQGGTPIPNFEDLHISSYQLGLTNNKKYQFTMEGILDYGDGGVNTNVRNSFSFDFTCDNEAPIIRNATYEKIYDKATKDYRYYVNLTVHDNHYVQAITPISFTSNSTYATLAEHPIPVYGDENSDTVVRFEITDYMDALYNDAIVTSSLSIMVEDYALNSNLYLVQLPGTEGDFKFTQTGNYEDSPISALTVYLGEAVDLTDYLATKTVNADFDKEYLRYLTWVSSNESIAVVKEGIITPLKTGRVQITVSKGFEGNRTNIIINIKEKTKKAKKNAISIDEAELNSIDFTYYTTEFAFLDAGSNSEIGETGSTNYFSHSPVIKFFPGEKVKINYSIDPWYIPEDRIELTWSSTNPEVASVDQEGNVCALKKGSASIRLNIKVDGVESNIMATAKVEVKSEFIIENRTLVAYKGLGGDVVIPDDEGILYIGSFAFCLYDIDRNIIIGETDYDKNKIPASNDTIRSVVVPEGVEYIYKYAFYNCNDLESVTLPKSCKFIREFAFYNDQKLESINLENVSVVGAKAFYNCNKLTNVKFDNIYAIGEKAFEKCSSLIYVDLTKLRNTGKEAFKDCTSLATLISNKDTKLSYGMFVNTGLTTLTLSVNRIPEFCFANCVKLNDAVINNALISVGEGAFSGCEKLRSIDFKKSVDWFEDEVFYNCPSLVEFTLPDGSTELGNYMFKDCTNLETLKFKKNSYIISAGGGLFEDTKLKNFVVDSESIHYSYTSGSPYLVSKDGNTLVLAAVGYDYDPNLELSFKVIGKAAFTGVKTLNKIIFTNPETIIEDYAFTNCETLTSVTLVEGMTIKNHAFNYASSLKEVVNLETIKSLGDYSFANTGLENVTIGDNTSLGEGAFYNSSIVNLTLGKNCVVNFGAFQNCSKLVKVNMPEEGNVQIKESAFANDISLNSIDLSKTTDTLGNEAFYGCTSLPVANLTNVKYVGDYAFGDCASLHTVTIPSVISIGESAFGRITENGSAPKISKIEFPSTLNEIKDGAFLGCQNLTSITIAEGITKVSDFAFSFCSGLTKVTLPESVVEIGDYSFYGCPYLMLINTENVQVFGEYSFALSQISEDGASLKAPLTSAITIKQYAFCNSRLSNIGTTNNLVTIGDYAFQANYFTEFVGPKVETIGEGAFNSNQQLEKVVLSNVIKNISFGAFNGCSSIKEFVYNDNGTLKNTGKVNDYLLLDKGAIYNYMPNGKLQLNSYPGGKTSSKLEVLDGTYRIELYAGNSNVYLEEIVFPDSLYSIANFAFYECNSLKRVEFKSFVAPVLESSYLTDDPILEKTDPGYELLHPFFDLFGQEVFYAQFINYVGKNDPIKMILPSNEDVKGYNSIIYEVYFGKVETASRSDYIARDDITLAYIDAYNQITKLDKITLSDDELISEAYSLLNRLKQDLTTVRVTSEEVKKMETIVKEAYNTLRLLKVENNQVLSSIQSKIDLLPETFSIDILSQMENITKELNNLSKADRNLLDLTKYDKVNNSYQEYLSALEKEIDDANKISQDAFNYIGLVISSVGVVTSLLGFAILKKKILRGGKI